MYCIVHEVPTTDIYRRLRAGAGLSAKTEEAARRGLSGSLFAVQVLHGSDAVGMARVIGDGGCFYQIVDMAVLPEHQGKGLGKRLMQAIMEYIDANVPQSGYVSLVADGKAQDLYARFGFVYTAPEGIGMFLQRRHPARESAGD